ncbi:redoxin family protein [Peptoniphilaceae bacterium SGI.131]
MKKISVLALIAMLALAACSNKGMDKDMHKKEEMKKDSMDKKEEMKKDSMDNKEGKMDESKSALLLKDLNGKEFDILNQKGKKVYAKFWASWCPICLDGLAELDKASAKDNGYEIVSVVSPGLLGEKNTEEFKKWFEGLGYKNIRVLLDEKGSFVEKYGIRSTPTNVIIDSNGELVKVVAGHLEKDLIDKIFAEVK